MIPNMKGGIITGTGDSCGTMTSDIISTASPTIPSAIPSRPVVIPSYLRARTGASSSPRGSPLTPGSSPGGSSIGCSPRGTNRRPLYKKNSNGGGCGPASNTGSPLAAINTKPASCENGGSKNAGSTPQTARKVYTLSTASTDRYSPNGSPRNTNRTAVTVATPKRIKNEKDIVSKNNIINIEESASESQSLQIQPEKKIRKSSKGDLGGGRKGPRLTNASRNKDLTVSIVPAGGSAKGCGNVTVPARANENMASTNTTIPEALEQTQSEKLEALWKYRRIEQGMVKIPTNWLDDLIRKESIEDFYYVEETPVARNQLTNVTVKKITHRETGVTYAAKFSSRFRYALPGAEPVDCSVEVLHEIAMLSVCTQSDKIVHLKDVFENKNEIILVLEYAPGGDFQRVLDEDQVPFEQDVQRYLRQVAEGLQYMHQLNIAHLDIKTENIVLMGEFPNCDIKLCDLEVARVIQPGESITEWIGTLDYMAPELYNLEPITLAADIWSFGVLAYALLSACLPFDGDTDTETIRNIQSQELDFPDALFEDVSEEATEFIRLCLNRDASKRPSINECLQHSWLAEEEEPPSPSPLMLKIPEPTFPPIHQHQRHHSDAGHRHGNHSGGGPHLGIPSRGPRSCQTCRDKIYERKRYLSKSREAIIEKATQSNLKKSLSKSRERLCDMRLTLSKSRDHLNTENIPKKLSKSQEKFSNLRSPFSKSQEVLSASLTHAKKGLRVGAVSDMNHAQHMVTAIMNDTDNTLDLVLVPGGHLLMSHPDLLRTNLGSFQRLPITESGRSTPGSVCSISTVHDIQCGNYGMYLNPPDGCMGPCGGPNGQSGSSTPSNPPTVVIAIPTVSEPPTIEPLLEVSEEEELETKSNASEGHGHDNTEVENKPNNKRMESRSILKKVQHLTTNGRGNKKDSHTSTSGTPPSKEEKETINYEKKQSMSRSASVDADIGRSGLDTNSTKAAKNNRNGVSENSGSSSSVNSKDIGIQVNLTKSTSSPNLVRKQSSNEKFFETMEIDIDQVKQGKTDDAKEKRERKMSSTRKPDSTVYRRSSCTSNNSKKDSFSHESMLGDGDDKPNYAWREELAKYQSQKPLRVSKLIGTFDKSGNEESSGAGPNNASKDLAALKRKRRGSLQIQLNEGILKDLAKAGDEARKKEAKEKEQRRKSTSSILLRNIENMKIQDKITDILEHGHQGVIEEKALEKTDVSEKLEPDIQNVPQEPTNASSRFPKKNGNNNNANKTNMTERSNAGLDKPQLIYNKEKQKPVDTNLTKRTSSPYLDRKLQADQKQKSWDYFEITHPKAISDKKLQELKAKYQRRRTEGTLLLEREKKVVTDTKGENILGSADTKTATNNCTGFGFNSSISSVTATAKDPKAQKLHQEPTRSNSVPVMETSLCHNKLKDKRINLDLSIDPLTGECLASRTETEMLTNIKEDSDSLDDTNNNKNDKTLDIKGSYTENLLSPSNCRNSTGNINIRKLSSDEEVSNSSSRRSSRSSRRKSSHLADIQEQYIPDEKILEVTIDPLTGQVETVEVCRSKSSPTPNSPNAIAFHERAMSFTSTQLKESEKVSESQDFDIEKRRKLSVEVTKVSPSTRPSGEQHDDGIGSLPDTPIDTFVERPPRLSVPSMDDGILFSNLDATLDKFGQFQREQRETSAGTSNGSGGGINQDQTISLDGGYGADSVSSWDESSSVAPDDDGDDLQSRPASAQPSASTSTLTVAASSNENLSSTSTSSSTSVNNGVNNTNQVNRTCSGAISRAMERFNANQPVSTCITAQSSTNSDNMVNNSMEDKEESDEEKSGSSDCSDDRSDNNSVMRRQSSPMVRPSSS